MSTQAEYLAKMQTQMKKWDTDVDALAAAGEKVNEQMRTAYDEQIKNLRAGREAAQRTFEQIGQATEAAGKQMRSNMESAWQNMQKSLTLVTTDLKK